MFSLSAAIAPNKTSTNRKAETFFAIGSSFNVNPEINLLNNIPNMTGTVTIKNISLDMLNNEMFLLILASPSKFAEKNTINGIVKTQSKLIIAVSDIERATSPLEKDVSKLDVTPPGAEAIIITPIASSGAMVHILTIKNAITGSIIICKKAPTKKSRGCFTTLKKSWLVNPNPKANIMKASAKGKIRSVTIFICVIIMI